MCNFRKQTSDERTLMDRSGENDLSSGRWAGPLTLITERAEEAGEALAVAADVVARSVAVEAPGTGLAAALAKEPRRTR